MIKDKGVTFHLSVLLILKQTTLTSSKVSRMARMAGMAGYVTLFKVLTRSQAESNRAPIIPNQENHDIVF